MKAEKAQIDQVFVDSAKMVGVLVGLAALVCFVLGLDGVVVGSIFLAISAGVLTERAIRGVLALLRRLSGRGRS